jgi:uncharacterized protein YjbI with pentapeptide repeats
VEQAQAESERAASEARYASAVQALGGDMAVQRVAGFTMMSRNIEDRLRSADDARSGSDALNLYRGTLDVFENYLKFPPAQAAPSEEAKATAERRFGTGRGVTQDQIYAAGQFRALLNSEIQELVLSLDSAPDVRVDLAGAPLYGLSLAGIDFAWLDVKYFVAMDVRGSNLQGSTWGRAALGSARMQCANLESTKSRNTDLRGADLHGASLMHANLRGADLRDADLRGADLTGAYVQGAQLGGAQLDGAITQDLVGESADRPEVSGAAEADVPAFGVDRCLDSGWALLDG